MPNQALGSHSVQPSTFLGPFLNHHSAYSLAEDSVLLLQACPLRCTLQIFSFFLTLSRFLVFIILADILQIAFCDNLLKNVQITHALNVAQKNIKEINTMLNNGIGRVCQHFITTQVKGS